MNKLLLIILLALSASAMAGPHGYRHGHEHGHWSRGYSGAWVWMVPKVIGVAIVYEAT